MTLNLNKHGVAMQEAWKDVSNLKSDTNWALFGYEGTTFDLKLIGKGQDGPEEMKEDLSSSKIMYGFLRIEDPKTSLPKFVFLHWQGEAVPGTRKGMSATHLRDVEKYFYGAHVTINARNEDEVDEDEIISKVAKSSASAFNFKEKQSMPDQAPPTPVGTFHKKINPKQELPNMDEREKFWNSEQNREKERISVDKDRKKSEAKQHEVARRLREEKEAAARELVIKERERKISKIKESEAKVDSPNSNASAASNKLWEAQQAEDAQDEAARQNRGEEIKRKRSQEARQLIGQRSTEARAVFERNSSVGQMNFKRQNSSSTTETSNGGGQQQQQQEQQQQLPVDSSSPDPVPELPKPVLLESTKTVHHEEPPKEVIENAANANEVSTEDIVVPPPMFFGNDDNNRGQQQPPQPAHEDDLRNEIQPPPPPDVTGAAVLHQPDLIQDVASKQGPDLTSAAMALEVSPEKQAAAVAAQKVNGSEFGVCAMALYDYQAADETEISFDPGQLVTHIDQIDPGWWQGLGPDGNYGLFPANYVEIVDPCTVKK